MELDIKHMDELLTLDWDIDTILLLQDFISSRQLCLSQFLDLLKNQRWRNELRKDLYKPNPQS